MGDSFIVKDPSAISGQIAAAKASIDEAKTTYQARKKFLEEKIAQCRESIAHDEAEKRKCEEALRRHVAQISQIQMKIEATRRQLESARQSLDSAKSASQGTYTEAVRAAENRVLHLERQWRDFESQLKDAQKKKAQEEANIKVWENRIMHKKTALDKVLALYSHLTGEGARELERTIQEGNAVIARCQKLLAHISGRPGM